MEKFKSDKDRFERMLEEEVDSIERLNRTQESLLLKEEKFCIEIHRISALYAELSCKFNSLKSKFDRIRPIGLPNTSMNQSMTSASARFPKISIPEFSGDVKDF